MVGLTEIRTIALALPQVEEVSLIRPEARLLRFEGTRTSLEFACRVPRRDA